MTHDANDILREHGADRLREIWDSEPCQPVTSNVASEPTARTLRTINPAEWEGRPVPSREWIVPDIIPARTVTLLYGDGGKGKSLIALQLAVARAIRQAWISTMPAPGRTIYLSAEDDAAEMHRRLDDIRTHYGVRLADLADMRLVDLVGEEAVLGHLSKGGIIEPTELYRAVASKIEAFKASLVIVDSLADVFAGDENHRSQARQFIALLKRLGREQGCTTLALAHPSITGMNSGSGLSGSTHWSNSVRSRLYFDTPKASDGSEPDANLRTLALKKANYAATGTTITVRWRDGVYVAEGGPGSLDKMAQANRADAVFLDLLRAYEAEGRHVSSTPSATYAPKIFSGDPRAEGIGKPALTAAMNRLFAAGKIKQGQHGRPSDPRKHIALAEPEGPEGAE